MTENLSKYLLAEPPIESLIDSDMARLQVKTPKELMSMLTPLKEKSDIHKEHYYHSLRVANLCMKAGEVLCMDAKALFFAGFFHDIGKKNIDDQLLSKKNWTKTDYSQIQCHSMEGFNILKGKFDFTAEVIVRHHTFQQNGYPSELPEFRHDYSNKTQFLINSYARILSIVDVYDALHRDDGMYQAKLSGEEIKQKLFNSNEDLAPTIEKLYEAGVF